MTYTLHSYRSGGPLPAIHRPHLSPPLRPSPYSLHDQPMERIMPEQPNAARAIRHEALHAKLETLLNQVAAVAKSKPGEAVAPVVLAPAGDLLFEAREFRPRGERRGLLSEAPSALAKTYPHAARKSFQRCSSKITDISCPISSPVRASRVEISRWQMPSVCSRSVSGRWKARARLASSVFEVSMRMAMSVSMRASMVPRGT